MPSTEKPDAESLKEGPPLLDAPRATRTGLLLAVVCAVQFLDAMDIASMGPALPVIQHDLGMSAGALQRVVSAYSLAFGGFLLLGGRLADLFGRKKLLLGWLAVFVIASITGGLTDNGTVLVIARLLKGVSAGFTAPVALAILLDVFRGEHERNRALGVFLAIASAGYSLGLVFGGLLADINWRLVLFLPALTGLLVIALAVATVPADRPRQGERGRVDVLGAVAVTGGVVALAYGVSHASTDGWTTPVTITTLAAAIVLLVLFVLIERAHKAPLVPLVIFTRPQLSRANICMLFFGAYVGFQFVLTLYYQNTLGWSPLQAGLAFLLGGVLTATAARGGAATVTRYGAWPVATAGLLLLTVGYLGWALLIGHLSPILLLLAQQLLGGIGFAGAYPALSIAAVGQAGESEQGLASGLFNTSSQIGAGLVIAITASALTLTGGSGLDSYRAGLWTLTIINALVTITAAMGIARYRRHPTP
ncbi:MFS transporter [Streptomyces sp. NPDC050610]|uniref:MFS transporter n=1 Tax=Streptomyces sp. NPDC050610 TaxID=3157097 RepID=UPI00343E9D70